ncbi:hypothetical protein LZ32DRAFT_232533 [Colletotrichum eremochloae]|nr:hypothetical protein LZ32DRAFT_232533 [Colletotrichum eremochloae]
MHRFATNEAVPGLARLSPLRDVKPYAIHLFPLSTFDKTGPETGILWDGTKMPTQSRSVRFIPAVWCGVLWDHRLLTRLAAPSPYQTHTRWEEYSRKFFFTDVRACMKDGMEHKEKNSSIRPCGKEKKKEGFFCDEPDLRDAQNHDTLTGVPIRKRYAMQCNASTALGLSCPLSNPPNDMQTPPQTFLVLVMCVGAQ